MTLIVYPSSAPPFAPAAPRVRALGVRQAFASERRRARTAPLPNDRRLCPPQSQLLPVTTPRRDRCLLRCSAGRKARPRRAAREPEWARPRRRRLERGEPNVDGLAAAAGWPGRETLVRCDILLSRHAERASRRSKHTRERVR